MTQPANVRLPGVMWHVTITLHGHPHEPRSLAEALGKLAFTHGIDLSARYGPDLVELRYWDEGQDCRRVVGSALDLWDSYRDDVDLPAWPVVGVEVLDRPTFRRRWPPGSDDADLFAPGVRPLLRSSGQI